MNSKHRANAKNEFEKDFFKLMNNSVKLGKVLYQKYWRIFVNLNVIF